MGDEPRPRFCIWLTGPPAAGKSTLAEGLAVKLRGSGDDVVVLDGDALRRTVSSDLGFDPASRVEQARRAASLALEAIDRGTWAIVALVSPSESARSAAKAVLGDRMLLVHVDASFETRRRRDPKGLYGRAAAGEISNLTGFDAPYDAPGSPDIHVRTDDDRASASIETIEAEVARVRAEP